MTWRPQQFRLGNMRNRISIQTATEAVSDAGDVTRTWATTYSNEPCKVELVSGGEGLRGRQVEADVSVIFTVHYRSAFTSEMRVVYSGTNYGIAYVRHVEAGRRYTELHCKAFK